MLPEKGCINAWCPPNDHSPVASRVSGCSPAGPSHGGSAAVLATLDNSNKLLILPWAAWAAEFHTFLLHVFGCGSWHQDTLVDLDGRPSYMVLGLQVLTHPNTVWLAWSAYFSPTNWILVELCRISEVW